MDHWHHQSDRLVKIYSFFLVYNCYEKNEVSLFFIARDSAEIIPSMQCVPHKYLQYY